MEKQHNLQTSSQDLPSNQTRPEQLPAKKTNRKKSLIIISIIITILVVTSISIILILRNSSDSSSNESSNNISTSTPDTEENKYIEAKQEVEEYITNHKKYKELEGSNLTYISKSSDLGILQCTDCDGFKYTFNILEGDTIEVYVDFDFTSEGIEITRADMYLSEDNDNYYDMLNDENIDENSPQQDTTVEPPSRDSTDDPYEGWSNYRNETWGIEFKHNGDGSEILTHDNTGNTDPQVSRIGYSVNPDQESGSKVIQVFWSLWENSEELFLNEFFDTYLDFDGNCTVNKNYIIEDNVVIKCICDERPTGVSSTDIYIIDSEKRIFRVSYLHYMDETLMETANLSIDTIKVD